MRLFASSSSKGKKLAFKGKYITIDELQEDSFVGVSIVFFAADENTSKKYASLAVARGAIVIDNSSIFRMDPEVPLVIPEINLYKIKDHRGIIANPNCSTIIGITPLWSIHTKNPIKRIIISTYQAASGAGLSAMKELEDSTRSYLDRTFYVPTVLPHPYAFNLFSHDSVINSETGYNGEETKIMNETKKIFSDDTIRIAATCIRVPVLRAHSASITFECESIITPADVRRILESAPGIRVVDDPAHNYFPMPIDASGQADILVGRIRQDLSDPSGKSISLFVSGDQLLKGAALNAVQISDYITSA